MYDKYDLDRMFESDSDYWRSTASEELKRYNERETVRRKIRRHGAGKFINAEC